MLGFVIAAIKIIFLLGFLILIHECGHFIAARLCKVKVNEFAIGMGPTVFKKEKKGTKYAIRLLPIGGFVNMEGEERRSDEEGSYSKKSIPKRMFILISGAIVNIIFALILYFIISSIVPKSITTIVQKPTEESYAESAGILPGDKILKINNKKVRVKSDFDRIMEKSTGENIDVKIQRNNEIIDLNFKPLEAKAKSIGVYFAEEGDVVTAEILAVLPNKMADKAGLQQGDTIVSINGIDVENSYKKIAQIITDIDEDEVEIVVKRRKELKTFELGIETKMIYYVGVNLEKPKKSFLNNMYYAIWDTRDFVFAIGTNLKHLFTGEVGVDQLTGPIGISTAVAKTNGVYKFVELLALISLSLGITNLLPFPPLDGGKVVIVAIEGIRKKPLKESIEMGLQVAGFTLIILLTIYVAYKDVLRIF